MHAIVPSWATRVHIIQIVCVLHVKLFDHSDSQCDLPALCLTIRRFRALSSGVTLLSAWNA